MEARNHLDAIFPDRWICIGRGSPVNRPARSPDLTSLEFFFWHFIKDKMMVTAPTTSDDCDLKVFFCQGDRELIFTNKGNFFPTIDIDYYLTLS